MESVLCFSLVALLSCLSLVFSQYILPEDYFINCGSSSGFPFTGRNFVGDVKPAKFSVHGGRAATGNNDPNTPSIYQTARVFTKTSWYELQADQNNTFVMVRLHFSPFSSKEFELSNSTFDVSVAGFPLLSNFSVGNKTVIKELIVPVQSEGTFRIEFRPTQGSSSAFVNAIEAFTTPSDLFRDDVNLSISPAGTNVDFENLTSYAFNPIHRINVGGQTITVENDSLRRNWVPDDPFISNSEPARNATYDTRPSYQDGGATQFDAPDNVYIATPSDAPDDVYTTAKQMKVNSTGSGSSLNLTWNFRVNKNSKYLVRAHFCDFTGTTLSFNTNAFNLLVYSHFSTPIKPVDFGVAAVPFYHDLVVDSFNSGFLNISIGQIPDNAQTAFLNGLEIIKLLNNSGSWTNKKEKNKNNMYIIVGCVVAGAAFVLILLVVFLVKSRYRKVKPVAGAKTESHAIPSYGGDSSLSMVDTINHSSPIPSLNLRLRIPFADILQGTNGFDETLMIGRGGFGKVYKGTLNGMKVAVKRGGRGHDQGRPEFVTEVMVLSRIKHRHLVSLIGYCDERSEMILVYEFMEKGTLRDHLYNNNAAYPKLSWEQRLEICISSTKGLNYLHTGSDGGIIHRDVKSTNILLDANYVAKVADFGISRVDNVDESEHSDIKGTFGYMDPEYFMCMRLTQKSDVYAFGVVLLEVLCARPALDVQLPPKENNLAEWAIRKITNGEAEEIVDPFLAGTINTNSLRKFLNTVERCLKESGDERPSMMDVLWDLEYALRLQQTATGKEAHDDSTMNTSSWQLSAQMLHRFPSQSVNEFEATDGSITSHLSESQVFSQMKIDEAR